jgi:hypothetical protein
MKFLANIVLLLFLSFLAAPTVVSLMEDKADISLAYSLTEEEMQKELAEVKYSPSEFHYALITITKKTSEIKSGNLQRHDNVFEEIFSPPPEQI